MRTLVSSVLFSTALATVAAPAFADDAAPSTTNAFATMDNTGDGSKLEAETSIVSFYGEDDDDDDELTLVRTSLLGQYLTPQGFGGYASLDVIHGFSDAFEDDYTELGNLQLGGLYQRTLSPNADLGVRVGLVLPTSTDDGTELLHVMGTMFSRPSEFATAVADSMWLRLGVSPTFHQGLFFARVDGGIDIPVMNPDRGDDLEVDLDPVGHVNAGVGVGSNGFVGTAELQNAFTFGEMDENDDLGDRFVHTAALSARYQGKVVSPYVAASTPLDDFGLGEVFTVTAGISGKL